MNKLVRKYEVRCELELGGTVEILPVLVRFDQTESPNPSPAVRSTLYTSKLEAIRRAFLETYQQRQRLEVAIFQIRNLQDQFSKELDEETKSELCERLSKNFFSELL